MPKRFMWRGADVYLPTQFTRGKVRRRRSDRALLGRLKPGITDAQAEADLRPIIEDLKKQQPTEFPETWRVAAAIHRNVSERHQRGTSGCCSAPWRSCF